MPNTIGIHLTVNMNEMLKEGWILQVPENYFPDDDPKQRPIVRWRSVSTLLFTNWLNYYVYQETPYIIEQIQK